MQFSNKGKYLAIACTKDAKSGSKTIIKIYDVEPDGKLCIILRGHDEIIHDLDWSSCDNYLVSASADGCAKVWNLKSKDNINNNSLKYTDNDDEYFICQLEHPCYVYGAKIWPDPSGPSGMIIVATACFD
jgi:WD40 repeat protein